MTKAAKQAAEYAAEASCATTVTRRAKILVACSHDSDVYATADASEFEGDTDWFRARGWSVVYVEADIPLLPPPPPPPPPQTIRGEVVT